MNIKFKDGAISIDLFEALQNVKTDQKVELIESLACDDDIIRHVAEQIINRWTESGYSGLSSYCPGFKHEALYGLDWAVRMVALASGEIAQREIKRLEKSLEEKEKENKELYNQLNERRY